ncbi:MAG TPA: tetratricopeptide repeat protein, partial [Acidobacteriota bacterium]|nr:tetratricopeptide repeat protein [Acidobacteriota bacterium]
IELGGNDGILLATYGTCLIYEKKYEAAVEKLERAVQLIPQNPAFSYNLACAYARLNQKEKALSALEQAVRTGFRDKSGMLADPDLENIRSDAKFQTLANSIGT